MSEINTPGVEPALFSAIITPHRSLGGTGFVIVMLTIGGVSFLTGLTFAAIGAWPVIGFLGLDVAIVYWAFRANYRSARAFEEVVVTASALTVRRVNHRGKLAEWTLNPLWTRLDRETHGDFGVTRLFLVTRGKRLPIAAFLSPGEKEDFAAALAAAIGEAKRGPTRSQP
ncbi:MAG: DUF2244 domain-containing protein [Proteobacteria bacterium]|nr:DUF2244 domain-containing protein [Pseudomonadota bacterium]